MFTNCALLFEEISINLSFHSRKQQIYYMHHYQTFFFKETCDSGFETVSVTGERYADMLENCIISSLADKYHLESKTFMQDGAPSHIAGQAKDFLHRLFGDDRMLSCHFCYALPSKSQDLSPCNYWLGVT